MKKRDREDFQSIGSFEALVLHMHMSAFEVMKAIFLYVAGTKSHKLGIPETRRLRFLLDETGAALARQKKRDMEENAGGEKPEICEVDTVEKGIRTLLRDTTNDRWDEDGVPWTERHIVVQTLGLLADRQSHSLGLINWRKAPNNRLAHEFLSTFASHTPNRLCMRTEWFDAVILTSNFELIAQYRPTDELAVPRLRYWLHEMANGLDHWKQARGGKLRLSDLCGGKGVPPESGRELVFALLEQMARCGELDMAIVLDQEATL